jgi:hypothetical protein
MSFQTKTNDKELQIPGSRGYEYGCDFVLEQPAGGTLAWETE